MPTGIYIRTAKHLHLENLVNFPKGYTPWNKGKKGGFWSGKKMSKEHIRKLSLSHKGKFKGAQGNNWKGNNIGYGGIHMWLRATFGKARKCEFCNGLKAKRFEWALVKGKRYERKRENFIMLCPSCHRKYDDIMPVRPGGRPRQLKLAELLI